MEKSKEKSSMGISIIRYAGTYIGAVIGAGFASGQEPMQFFVSYGYLGIIGAILLIVLFAWYGYLFMLAGHKLKVSAHGPILNYLCGEKIGKIFDWILTFFLFGVLAIMISGGGSALNQYFGLNILIGKVIITVLSVGTILLGFSSALSALGFLSTIIIIVTLTISIATICGNIDGIGQAGQIIQGLELAQATPFWLLSTFIYVSYCVLPTLPTLATIGNMEPEKRIVKKSAVIGGSIMGIAVLCMVLALLSRIEDVSSYQIPFLEVAKQIHPVIGFLFTLILLAAIYTTSVPILYGFSIRFAEEKTKKFYGVTILAAVVAFIAGMFPFDTLVGTVYPLLGYIGMIVMIAGAYKMFIKKDLR